MSIYGNSVRRPLTTILIFIALIVMGLYSLTRLPVDLYPDMEFPFPDGIYILPRCLGC